MTGVPDLQTQMADPELRQDFWATLALRHTHGLGARSWTTLLHAFGSAARAMQAWEHWAEHGIPRRVMEEFASMRWQSPATEEWNAAFRVNACVLLWSEARYPDLLRKIPTVPPLLYYRGDPKLLTAPCLGVVGSRHPSQEGLRTAARLAGEVAACGVTVVSGMAKGIDRSAHLAAVRHVGSSVAVLGTGIDIPYPVRNRDVMAQLALHGCVVTELAPGTGPHPRNFPVRNRIISGLSLGILLVEAAMRSGSLVTARHALEQDRDVYAVPGALDSTLSAGCQQLIREGAQAIFSAEDILRDLAPRLRCYGIGASQLQQRMEKMHTKRHTTQDMPAENLPTMPPEGQKTVTTTHLAASFSPPSTVAPAAPARTSVQEPPAVTRLLSRPEALRVLDWLEKAGRCNTDQLCEALGMAPGVLAGLLVALEMGGQIRRFPGGFYERSRR